MNSRDAPSHMLLVLISNLHHTFPLTNDTLFELFNPHGDVKRILIFQRGTVNKAFIEFSSVQDAISARKALIGKWISTKGQGKMMIHFSRIQKIDLDMVENSRGSEYSKEHEIWHPSKDREQITTYSQQTDRKISRDTQQEYIRLLLNTTPSNILLILGCENVELTNQKLINVFSTFGRISKISSYASHTRLIYFFDIDSAYLAKEWMHNQIFLKCQLNVHFANHELVQQINKKHKGEDFIPNQISHNKSPMIPSTKLLLSGLPDHFFSQKVLLDILTNSKIKEPKKLSFKKDLQGANYCLIELSSVSDAIDLMAALQFTKIDEQVIFVEFCSL